MTPFEYVSVLLSIVISLALAGLHLLIEQGRYDLATPAFALKYNLDHLRLTPEARQRIHVNYHDAGHMMYLNAPAARSFRENVVSFIRETDRL